MQAFYWDCPREDDAEGAWWSRVRDAVPSLADAGFTALWLPPVHKAANIDGRSMGYDPYDYYDLGEFDQKGGIPTWFGTRQELDGLIATAHSRNMAVLADMVINHNSGADAAELNPIINQERWTKFEPMSGRFKRNWQSFHPCMYESGDDSEFAGMPDLAHRNPEVMLEILKLARWLVEEIGFDGFRYDFAKGYSTTAITAIQEYRYMRGGDLLRPFGVAEHWSDTASIDFWVNAANAFNDNPVNAFDFPLRAVLKAMCDARGFDLRKLSVADTLTRRQPERAVTFVENHDMRDGRHPIINDKMLAYAYILTHEGYPCVFWKDYFNHELAMQGTPHGIAALVNLHEGFAGGTTRVLWEEETLYVIERSGHDDLPGLVFVLNTNPTEWQGAYVSTGWENTLMTPEAWWSAHDLSEPEEQWTSSHGDAGFWAPPRGFAVYVPGE